MSFLNSLNIILCVLKYACIVEGLSHLNTALSNILLLGENKIFLIVTFVFQCICIYLQIIHIVLCAYSCEGWKLISGDFMHLRNLSNGLSLKVLRELD